MRLSSAMVVALLLAAPAHAKKDKAAPVPPERPEASQVEQGPPPAPGSLFDPVAARQLMGMHGSAREVGDLITVRIREQSDTNLAGDTTTSRESHINTAVTALIGIEKRIKRAHRDVSDLAVIADTVNTFSGGGETSQESALEATLTCEVIEVLPTGNLFIWGQKRVRVSQETQYITLSGVIRARDVQMDNTVGSDVIADLDIEFTGSGVVSEAQRVGWGRRLLNLLWPF